MTIVSQSDVQNPRLTGTRCRCAVCGKNFNSTSSFDRHRYGDYQQRGANRRCRTWQELRTLGWTVNKAGFWIERPRLDAPPKSRDPSAPATTPPGVLLPAMGTALAERRDRTRLQPKPENGL
jgi:hypothetical protein